jgi:predicted transcriptional regulator
MSDDILELETRRRIFQLVSSFPGLHMREIQRKLKLSIALAEYHLIFLEKANLITSISEGGYKRFYVKEEDGRAPGMVIGHPERKILGLLRQRIPLQITLFLLGRKQATHSDISKSLEVSPSKLSFHLKKLLRSGVVRKLERDEGKGYAIADGNRIFRLLLTHKPAQDMLDEFSDLWDNISLL